jgi:hypothetical protein
MPQSKLFEFFSDPMLNTWRAIVRGYAMLRELDEMTLGTLLAYLRDR